jgi:hypothetical protein
MTGTGLDIANGVPLVTYRVTCPNGSYDDAIVYGDINGSVEACLAPIGPEITDITSTEATATWAAPDPAPSGGYEWLLYEQEPFFQLVASGSTVDLTVALTGMEAGKAYVFYVRSVCDGGEFSNYVQSFFNTSESSTSCGKYRVFYNDGTGDRGNSTEIEWMDCSGVQQSQTVFNLSSRIVCALQNSPGDPVDIVGGTTITYQGLC